MAFNPTGDRIAWSTKNKDKRNQAVIAVCSLEPGSDPRYMSWTEDISAGPVISPDGTCLTCGARENQASEPQKRDKPLVKVWNVNNGTQIRSLTGHLDAITSVAFSPDGKQLASASEDQTIKIWDMGTSKEIATLYEEQAALCLALSPDGQRLASGSVDGTVKLWSHRGRGAQALSPKGPNLHVAFSPDGQRLVGSGGSAVIWDVKTLTVLQRPESLDGRDVRAGSFRRVEWSPDSRYLAAGALGQVWDVEAGRSADSFKYLQQNVTGYGFAFSRDGRLVAACRENEVRLWDRSNGRCLNIFQDDPTHSLWRATCVAFSPDGRLLAGCWSMVSVPSKEGALRVWDVASGQDVCRLERIHHGVWKVAFSPDGKRLAAAMGPPGGIGGRPLTPGTVKLWDTATWEEVALLRGHSTCIWGLAFSPDSRRLAAASRVWERSQPPQQPGEVIIWDAVSWHELITLENPTAGVFGVAFSPDGRRLATASLDGTVKIWDGTPLAEVPIQIE